MNIILRKTKFLILQRKRFFKKAFGSKQEHRSVVLANSFPKSGTHLLTQILEQLPHLRNYLSFLASLPSWRYLERSPEVTLRRIRGFVDGEMVSAHLFFRSEYAQELSARGVIHYFIYRDPRDVVCSEAHYLATMAPFHRLHRVFKRQSSEAERISFSILGDSFAPTPVPYANVCERFRVYEGWLNDPEVCAVRFEDLVGERQVDEVRRICRWFKERSPACEETEDALVDRALAAIAPEKSHTFRKGGGLRNWERRFTLEHKEQFKSVAGALLVQLGYEENDKW